MSRTRSWVFTLNNYSDKEESEILEILEHEAEWGICGREVGENGTPHLQGAVRFENPRTMAGVKRMMGTRLHLEKMRGTHEESKTYCSKEGNFKEFGQCPKDERGRRSDLETIRKMWREGAPLREIYELIFDPVQMRALEGYKKMWPRWRPVGEPDIIWIWGKSGHGKSHHAEDIAAELSEGDPGRIWRRGTTGEFLEAYSDQDIVILDDLDRRTFDLKTLLKPPDTWRFIVNQNFGSASWMAKTVIVTALESPKEFMMGSVPEVSIQLERRIKKTIHMVDRVPCQD